MAQQDQYTLQTIKFPNCTARVYRPVLADEERAKRIKQIHNQSIKILMEELRNERNRT